ncbi:MULTISPECIES: MerR family DNA-binding protein [Streptomyces]|uniref:MerR family DNA-binding protein n=1 Tax=Streptomyces TaxID=1883 RepID=UPI0033B2158E
MRDSGESPCAHVGRVLTDHLDHVRAQIAELVTLEAHLEKLLNHAAQDRPTEHDNAAACWILEADFAEGAATG